MNTCTVATAAILCLGLGGCASQVPVPATYPVTYQKKMQAAEHWDILSADVAHRLRDALMGSSETSPARATALYVQRPQYESDFGEAFHELLITHLLAQGFSMSESPSKGLPVTYHVQLITHKDRGYIRPKPGTLTALAGGVMVLHDLGVHSSVASGVPVMLGAAGLDVAAGFITDDPNSEIIVTTSVMSGDQYVARLRDIYYVSDNNATQYMTKAPVSTRAIEVVGP